LNAKYGKKFGLASGKELPESTETIQKYIADKMSVAVNGKPAVLTYFTREYEDDMLVVYYTVPAPKK
jgi:ribose 1,5-bisphosphokinase PhnN